MGKFERLLDFEKKYAFLYEIGVRGFPIYPPLREKIEGFFDDTDAEKNDLSDSSKKIYFKRTICSFFKKRKLRKCETLIFTSSVYRRDRGRNLAAEFLMEKYPNSAVFEWPSRNKAFDDAYFSDPNKRRYCPLDWFSVRAKLYSLFHKKEYAKLKEDCLKLISPQFNEFKITSSGEKKAIEYILEHMPEIYANTVTNQKLFAKYFKKFKNVKHAIDFWGGARENIIPVLKGSPEYIELQHGIIMSYHTGYIYPEFVGDNKLEFFKRKILVYGDTTKNLLVNNSIFDSDQIEVVGNPRVKMYKKVFPIEKADSKLIMFASQSYEQDGTGVGYYDTVTKILKAVKAEMQKDKFWQGFTLGVKLHPRENNKAIEFYKREIPDIEVFDNTSQLFEIINKSYVQLTVSSTTLYEAAEFDTPTVSVKYAEFTPMSIYGFETLIMSDDKSVKEIMQKLQDKAEYQKYLSYLKNKTKEFM